MHFVSWKVGNDLGFFWQIDLAERVERMKISPKQEEHLHQGIKKGKFKEDVVTPDKVKGTVAAAQLRATFYPKFENEKSDQEVILSSK